MGGCLSSPVVDGGAPTVSREGSIKGKGVFKVPSVSKLAAKSVAPIQTITGDPLDVVDDIYEIGPELGRGLFGVTRCVVHKASGNKYACKTINKLYAEREWGAKGGKNKRRVSINNFSALQRELSILRHVTTSRHVASLHEVHEDHHSVHLILDLCQGGMLYDTVKEKGQYSEREAARIVRSMVEGVGELQGRGVVHRDLKLENFLWESKEEGAELRVIDFGLSAFFEPGQRFSEIVGSAYYVAPEVLRKDYGPECDIWSCGVITYMLLSGVPPFWDYSEAGICAAVLRGSFDMSKDPWGAISDSAKDVIGHMLEMDVNKRWTAEQILAHDWVRADGVASDRPIPTAILARVKQFVLMNRMKRHAYAVIAGNCLDSEELSIIQEEFERLDTNADGLLTFQELWDGIRAVQPEVSEEAVKSVFVAADIDNSGSLDLSEYASAIMVKRMDSKRMKKAFDYFDQGGGGFITAEDLRAVLREGDEEGAVEGLIDEVDKNKDGKIDYEEFEAMMLEGTEKAVEGLSLRGSLGRLSRLGEYYACDPHVQLDKLYAQTEEESTTS